MTMLKANQTIGAYKKNGQVVVNPDSDKEKIRKRFYSGVASWSVKHKHLVKQADTPVLLLL